MPHRPIPSQFPSPGPARIEPMAAEDDRAKPSGIPKGKALWTPEASPTTDLTPPATSSHATTHRAAIAALLLLMALTFPSSGTRAADAGELFVKGHACLTGQGEPRDATRAAAFFLDAARQGEPQAQFQLGVLFMEGRGVPADIFWAYFWLSQALKSPALPEAAREQASGRLSSLWPRLSQNQRRRLGPAFGS